jgi:branched-chain amino acid aminotransferase
MIIMGGCKARLKIMLHDREEHQPGKVTQSVLSLLAVSNKGERTRMPIPVGIYTRSGEFKPAPYQVEDMPSLAKLEPSGIYTVARTYHFDQAVLLEAHFDRLEESARLEEIPLDLDRQGIRRCLRELIQRAGFEEARFRLTIPRDQPDRVIIALEPLDVDVIARQRQGVTASTLYVPRENPRAKRTEWVAVRDQARKQLQPGVVEGLRLLADGTISEGFSSNFYGVMGGVLRTADEDILFGISRQIVLKVAPEILPVELRPIHENEIPDLQEAFRSGSSRGIVPIVRINGNPVGAGKPGPKTLALMHAYDAWVEAHLEPI